MSTLLSKIPWASRGHDGEHAPSPPHEDEGESLTTILTSDEDRSALTILVADCAQAMRQSLVDVFDARQTGKDEDLVADPKALQDLKIDDSKPDAELTDAERREKAGREKARRELERREAELSSERFQQLQKGALAFFDDWSNNAIQRIGEVLNSRAEAVRQQQEADPETAKKELAAQQAVPPMKFPKPTEYDAEVDRTVSRLYPPIKTSLRDLPEDKRVLILHSLLLLLLSLEHYHAHSRVLLLRITSSLALSISVLGEDESKVARSLLTAAESMHADDETKKKAEENKSARQWKVGLAAAAGAALIGVTGGLAAPLLAAGVGSVMGGLGLGATAAAGYLGTLAGSSVLVGGLFGAYGGRMTSRVMDQYAREVEDFGFEPVRSAHRPRKIEKEFRRLRVGIGISGWLTRPDDVVAPWKPLGVELEAFALRWELEALMNLGNSLSTMVRSAVWSVAKKEIIQRTVFAALTAGLWPLALLKASRIIDNPWSVASYRAQKAGEVLADALINKAQGERPVTLVGYSLGAKVIYSCLQQLAARRAFGLIESVVLIGAPTPSDSADWRVMRSVVCGRVVNVYSTSDYILGFLYRSSSVQLGVAGLQAVENVKGIENVDVSDMTKEGGHTSYRLLTGAILKRIGFEDVDYAELEKENAEFREEEEKAERERSDDDKNAASEVSDDKIKSLENEVEEKNKESYLGWAQSQMMSAGSSASVAYEKAKQQWFSREQSSDGKAATESAPATATAS